MTRDDIRDDIDASMIEFRRPRRCSDFRRHRSAAAPSTVPPFLRALPSVSFSVYFFAAAIAIAFAGKSAPVASASASAHRGNRAFPGGSGVRLLDRRGTAAAAFVAANGRRSAADPPSRRRTTAPARSSPPPIFFPSTASSLIPPTVPPFSPAAAALFSAPILPPPSSLLSAADSWSNVAALSGIAALAQALGRSTSLGRLLGPPVTAMALAFAASSIDFVPVVSVAAASAAAAATTVAGSGGPLPSLLSSLRGLMGRFDVTLAPLLPPGGSSGSRALQSLSLTLATPLLLLGADLRSCARRCGGLLGSFVLAALGTLAGASLAMSLGGICRGLGVGAGIGGALDIRHALQTSMGSDGLKIASALLAKNVGGGINYVAVASCLGASPAAVAAGLCVDNVFALAYFPITSALAAGRPDVEGAPDDAASDDDDDAVVDVESTSRALALSALFTALGQKIGGKRRLELPASTLLTVLFATFAPRKFAAGLRPAGELLGTVLLYLFFATAGAPGWRLAGDSTLKDGFGPLTAFLAVLYSVHGLVLWGARASALRLNAIPEDAKEKSGGDSPTVPPRSAFVASATDPRRLLVASSAAIGGPATAAALARSAGWERLVAPALLVGNAGYAVATFLGIAFHGAFSR